MYDAIAIGEILIDFVMSGTNSAKYPVLSAYPGGAPVNYLAVLAKFGMKTSVIAKVGTDAFANLLLQSLKEYGIDSKEIIQDERFFTTLAFVTLDKNGNREFSFARKPGADMCLSIDEINIHKLRQARSIYFGTTSLTAGPMRETVHEAVAYAEKHGIMTVFDPNLRKPLWSDLKQARQEMLWGLLKADIVKISEEEVDFLFESSIEQAAERMREQYGISLVLITLGEKGCYFSSQRACGYVEGLKGIEVTDTTGAGDIFAGSAVYQILQSGRRPDELCQKELYDMVRFACTSAGLSTTRPGGMSSVGDREEIIPVMERFYQMGNHTNDDKVQIQEESK